MSEFLECSVDKPSEPHVKWNFEWRDEGRFHVWHFYVDEDFRGRGHGRRLLSKIVAFVCRDTDAECFSIQMGGGADSARWLWNLSKEEFEYLLVVKDVQGYSGDDWNNQDAERIDDEEDMEGDEQSSIYAVLEDLDVLREIKGWC